jgi:purine-binding chemotaxis protein CheW
VSIAPANHDPLFDRSEDLRPRIAAALDAFGRALLPDPGLRDRTLADRARDLARPIEQSAAAESEFITFQLGRSTYAVPARDVLGVVKLTRIAPLPGATLPIVGLTSFRGTLLTLLDVRKDVGASGANGEMAMAVIVGTDETAVGILVESVDLKRFRSDALQPPAGEGLARPELLAGVTSDATMVLESSALARLHN